MHEARAQVLLEPATQPRFINPLPLPARIDATSGGLFTVTMAQTQQDLGLVDPVLGVPLLTTVWGYDSGAGPTYPGATIEADVGVDRPGRYVWHCHILSHEDHEMMRPYQVMTP